MLVSSAKKKHHSFQFKFLVTFADKFVTKFRKKPDASVETDSQGLCHKATSVFHQSLAFTGIQSVKCFSLENGSFSGSSEKHLGSISTLMVIEPI